LFHPSGVDILNIMSFPKSTHLWKFYTTFGTIPAPVRTTNFFFIIVTLECSVAIYMTFVMMQIKAQFNSKKG
jgi:hypothetical protein